MRPTRHAPRGDAGFTLVELLVVIAILALLGGLAITKIRGIQIDAKKGACEQQLKDIHAHLRRYELNRNRGGKLPKASGSDFILAIWGDPFVEKSANNSKLFFCPSLGDEGLSDEEAEDDMDGALIHYAGRDQENHRVRTTDQKNSSKIIIACDKPLVDSAEPHSGHCLCVLYLNGATGQIERDSWGDDVEVMTIGEESPVEALQGVVGSPDDDT